MSNRYQTLTWTTATINAGATGTGDQASVAALFNVVKVKIVPDSGSETFNFRIYKDAARTKRLIRWESIVPPLIQPIDRTAGLPGVEMYEGVPFPYDDDDHSSSSGSGQLHWELVNNGVSNHTYTITIVYEEVPLMSAGGAATYRGGYASNSILLTGATSGTVIVTVQAAAGTWTLTLPTSAGSSGQVLRTDGTGVTSWVTPAAAGVTSVTGTTNQVTASPTTGAVVLSTPQNIDTAATPQFARLGLGAAADATAPLSVVTASPSAGSIQSKSGTDLVNDYAQLQLIDNTAVAAGIGGLISFAGYYTGTTAREWAAIQGAKENATDGNYAGTLRFFTRANGSAGFSAQERMRIDSSGNVGIGATSPNALGLHIKKASVDVGLFIERTTDVAATSQIYVDANGDLALYNLNTAKKINFITNNATRVSFRANGDVVLNASGSALATNATALFTFLPTCAGTPTGAPSAYTGAIACVVDTTAFKLWANFAGTWKSTTFA